MKMLNKPCGTPLINDHQPDVSHPLSPEVQLLFSLPSSLFLQPIFLQLPNENALGDGNKIINQGVLHLWPPPSPHRLSHCCRRQSMLTISDYLLTFLPSYPSHVCEWFSRRHVPWSFQEPKWSWLAFTQWSSQGCPFFTSWGLTACVFPVVIQQSQPPRFVRENRQRTMKSHKLILSALLGKPHPAPYIWIHPGSPSSTYCVVPPLFPVLPVSKLCWHTQWSGSKLCLWKPK